MFKVFWNKISFRSIQPGPCYILFWPVHNSPIFPSRSFMTHSLLFCSPVVFTMEALLNPLFVDGDVDRIRTVVSDMHNIFNAIKRAEDALDVQKTSVSFVVFCFFALFTNLWWSNIVQKLHILANLGAKYLIENNISGMSLSHTPTNILLPSSLFRKSNADRKQASVN